MQHTRSSTSAWFLRGFKFVIVALVIWGIYRAYAETWQDLLSHSFSVSLPWAGLAGLLYLAGLLPSGVFWFLILRAMDQRPKLLDALTAYFVSHLGKYVPGKAMVVVLRASLVRGENVRASVAAVSAILETLVMMSSGALLAAVTILLRFREHLVLSVTAIGLLLVAAVPVLPPVFRRLVRLLPGKIVSPDDALSLEQVHFRLIATGMLLSGVGWLLMSASLWATLVALDVPNADLAANFPLYVASVTLAVVAGFLSLIPGGAGVRELILGLLVARRFGDPAALLSALFLRLIWLAAEILVAGALYGSRLWRKRTPVSESSS